MVLLIATACAGLAVPGTMTRVQPGVEQMALAIGTPAPSMRFRDGGGTIYTNDDFTGKSILVLAFYPNAFTGG